MLKISPDSDEVKYIENMPKISIIVPIYGVENYISRCVNSLFAQTLDDIEFIFVDDCTPDRSIEILEEIVSKNSIRCIEKKWTVKIERLPKNVGIAGVRRYGTNIARGRYITQCDSDDWVQPTMYEMLYNTACIEDADIVVCDFAVSNEIKNLKTIQGCRTTDVKMFLRRLMSEKDVWSVWNKLFKRELFLRKDFMFPQYNMGEDLVLTIQAVLNSNKISYVPYNLYNYYYNANSITRVKSENKKMDNFYHNKKNVDLLCTILKNRGVESDFLTEIIYLKWSIKRKLWQTEFNKDKYKLWKSCYKEINSRVFFNPHISFNNKLKFILTYLHLFPR